MKIIKYLTQKKKFLEGDQKTNHQLKFSTSTNFREQSKTSILQTKKNQQILMDKSPHQLAKNDVN